MVYGACSILHVAYCMLYTAYCMQYDTCCMQYPACFMAHTHTTWYLVHADLLCAECYSAHTTCHNISARCSLLLRTNHFLFASLYLLLFAELPTPCTMYCVLCTAYHSPLTAYHSLPNLPQGDEQAAVAHTVRRGAVHTPRGGTFCGQGVRPLHSLLGWTLLPAALRLRRCVHIQARSVAPSQLREVLCLPSNAGWRRRARRASARGQRQTERSQAFLALHRQRRRRKRRVSLGAECCAERGAVR